MVARLVQQHAIGLHQQDAGERHAHLPAAGEQADIALHSFLAEAQPRQHLARPRIQRIAIQLLEAPLDLAIALDDRVHVARLVWIDHRGLELGHFGGQRAHRPDTIHHRRDRALTRHFADILAEIADRHAGIDRHMAIIGPILAGDHPEKRRLAGAIRPDKSNLLTLLNAHRRLDEQELMAVLLADVLETNHEVRAGWKRVKRPWRIASGRGVSGFCVGCSPAIDNELTRFRLHMTDYREGERRVTYGGLADYSKFALGEQDVQ